MTPLALPLLPVWLMTVYLECSLVPMSLLELSSFDDMFLKVESSPELDFLALCPVGEQCHGWYSNRELGKFMSFVS